MVSSGTVSGHASELKQHSGSFLSQIEGLSSSWSGASHDSIVRQSNDLYSQIQQVVSQLDSFAEAVGLYEKYKAVKENYLSYVNAYNQLTSSEDQSLRNSYSSKIAECERTMRELSNQIQAALSAAASFSMDATSVTGTDAVTTQTEDATGERTIGTEGGTYVAENTTGVFGHITSSIDGKTFTIYNQTQIAGWGGDCNRAAASSIASAYASYSGQAVDVAKKSADGIGYKSDVTNEYFSNFGLTANITKVNGSYDTIKDDLVSNLSQGNYVMFDLARPSGQRWTYKRHWLSVLDIKRTGDGPNDYAIFVSDSAHHGSDTDHGLGTGWYSIDEFSGKDIANFTTVTAV